MGCVGATATGNDAVAENADVANAVDGYITHYFRRVAELSRESVYQSHQRDILNRMREDLADGDRRGSLAELDEMIDKVDMDDRSLRAEIAALMQIAGRENVVENCPRSLELGRCCCGGNRGEGHHNIESAGSSESGRAHIIAPLAFRSATVGPDGAAARKVPACDACTVQ